MVRFIVLIVLLIILSGGTHFSHRYLNMIGNSKNKIEYMAPTLSPEVLKTMSLGYENFIADYYWLTAIQYYGGKAMANSAMPQLYSLFDIITTLDPKFVYSYLFASYVLSDADSPTRSLEILQKGFRANPEEWEIPYQIGFVYYLYFKSYRQAAHYFEIAGKIPGAPNAPSRLAAMLYTKVGQKRVARILWERALVTAPDKYAKEKIERHIIELKIQEDIDLLKEAIIGYKIKKQESKLQNIIQKLANPNDKNVKIKPTPPPADVPYPKNLSELVTLGVLQSIPKDPYGRDYLYDPIMGTVYNEPLPWEKK